MGWSLQLVLVSLASVKRRRTMCFCIQREACEERGNSGEWKTRSGNVDLLATAPASDEVVKMSGVRVRVLTLSRKETASAQTWLCSSPGLVRAGSERVW